MAEPTTTPAPIRRETPVVLTDRWSVGSYWAAEPGARGVVLRLKDFDGKPGATVAWDPAHCEGEALAWVPLSRLTIDFDSPTGRAHAAWYVRSVAKDVDLVVISSRLKPGPDLRVGLDFMAKLYAEAVSGQEMAPGRVVMLRRSLSVLAGAISAREAPDA